MRVRISRCRDVFVGLLGIESPGVGRRVAMLGVLFAMINTTSRFALANSVSDFGLEYTSLGNATLSLTAQGTVLVSNIGSSGQDGVSVALPADVASPTGTGSFSLDTSANFGTLPVGAYFKSTNYGPSRHQWHSSGPFHSDSNGGFRWQHVSHLRLLNFIQWPADDKFLQRWPDHLFRAPTRPDDDLVHEKGGW